VTVLGVKGAKSVHQSIDSLNDLLTDVVLARTDLQRRRRIRMATRHDLGTAQHRLVDALRAYDAALDAKGAPMPYRLRDELRLLEALDRRDLSV
jgi:hypothetical protein